MGAMSTEPVDPDPADPEQPDQPASPEDIANDNDPSGEGDADA